MSWVRSITRHSVCSSILRCCTGERSLSKIMSGASLAEASARISSSLPRPTNVPGPAASRSWNTVPPISAPALRANSTSSASDSRSGAPAGPPGMRGERFHATPTRSARSVEDTACVVFIAVAKEPGSGALEESSSRVYAGWKTEVSGRESPRAAVKEIWFAAGESGLRESLGDQGLGCGPGLRIVAESAKPAYVRFPPKPRELALGILARALFDRGFLRRGRDFAAQVGAQFAIADKVKGLGAFGETRGDQTAHLVEPAGCQHRFSAPVNSLIERLPRGLEADFQDPPAGKRRSAGAMHFAQRFAGEQANLNGPDEFLLVRRGDLRRRLRIEAGKHFVQVTRAVFLGRCAESLANFFRALRQIGQTFNQCPKIEPGADGEDGQARTPFDVGKSRQGLLAIAAGGRSFSRIKNVEQMVWYVLALRRRWLRRSDIKAAIKLRGIAGNDFAAELLREKNSERGLAGRSRPENDDQQRERRHGNRICHAAGITRTRRRAICRGKRVGAPPNRQLLVGGFQWEIVQEDKAQADFRAAEG